MLKRSQISCSKKLHASVTVTWLAPQRALLTLNTRTCGKCEIFTIAPLQGVWLDEQTTFSGLNLIT